MPVFTTRLIDLVDDGFDLGMAPADYPIFDEAYRVILNQRIIDHYALYEIGQETPRMFKFALNRRLREVMKYYNQLYLSEKIVFDPLSTMDYTDDNTSTGLVNTSLNGTSGNTLNSQQDSTNHSTSATTSRARVVNSELPQVHLSPDEDYASSGADTSSDTTVTGDGTSATTGLDSTSGTSATTGVDTSNGSVNTHTLGRQGPAAALLMGYRASLLNIDLMVVLDCANLFMGIWNTSDEYASSERIYGNGSTYGYVGTF